MTKSRSAYGKTRRSKSGRHFDRTLRDSSHNASSLNSSTTSSSGAGHRGSQEAHSIPNMFIGSVHDGVCRGSNLKPGFLWGVISVFDFNISPQYFVDDLRSYLGNKGNNKIETYIRKLINNINFYLGDKVK